MSNVLQRTTRRRIKVNSVATILLLGLLTCAASAQQSATPAQQPQPPTLDAILQKLQDNLDVYHHDIPSFLCDEHAISKTVPLTPFLHIQSRSTDTDSTFRVKRTMNDGGTTTLIESRDIKSVNGRAAAGTMISGPAIFSGAFSGEPVIVSVDQTVCMSYRLRPIQPGKPNDPYIVEFASKPANQRPANCVLSEDGIGLAVVDPSTLQVTHLEFKVPKHTIFAGGKSADGSKVPPTIGVWVASIDYAKVTLEAKTFWMPSTIDAKMTGGLGPSVWSFNAHYSNYHKLEVTSRILPASSAPAK